MLSIIRTAPKTICDSSLTGRISNSLGRFAEAERTLPEARSTSLRDQKPGLCSPSGRKRQTNDSAMGHYISRAQASYFIQGSPAGFFSCQCLERLLSSNHQCNVSRKGHLPDRSHGLFRCRRPNVAVCTSKQQCHRRFQSARVLGRSVSSGSARKLAGLAWHDPLEGTRGR